MQKSIAHSTNIEKSSFALHVEQFILFALTMWNKVDVSQQDFTSKLSAVSPVIDVSKMDFDQACRPVLLLMNLIGVPLKSFYYQSSPNNESWFKFVIVMAFALTLYFCSIGTALFQHLFDPTQYSNGKNLNFLSLKSFGKLMKLFLNLRYFFGLEQKDWIFDQFHRQGMCNIYLKFEI